MDTEGVIGNKFTCVSSKLIYVDLVGCYQSQVVFVAPGTPGGTLTLNLDGEQKLYRPGEQYEITVRKC